MNVSKKVIVVDYNPIWNEVYNNLCKVYRNFLDDLVVDIQHVGSTSVEGLAAKPIIDIDIIIHNDPTHLEKVTEILNELGYSFLGDMGIEGRYAFLQTKNTVPDTGIVWYDHNLYVCFENSLGLKNHLELRNYLRKNQNDIVRYSALKKEIARKFPFDIDKYVEAKSPMIFDILKKTDLTIEEINKIQYETKLSVAWISEQKKMKVENNVYDTSRIREKILSEFDSIENAIINKPIYFRISLLSKCNKTCYFCHSEGGDANMQIDYITLISIIETAIKKGFNKIQFTGGEPLIYKHFENLCLLTNKYPSIDFGVTTNGLLLKKHQEKILNSNISRVHISLDVETIRKSKYLLPDFISVEFLEEMKSKNKLINITIPLENDLAEHIIPFLENNRTKLFNIRIFTIMDEKHLVIHSSYQEKLANIIEIENSHRKIEISNLVTLRPYLFPKGVRCEICPDLSVCCERGRSLRFGSDNIFRPCLVSREWDYKLSDIGELETIFDKAILNSLDF